MPFWTRYFITFCKFFCEFLLLTFQLESRVTDGLTVVGHSVKGGKLA